MECKECGGDVDLNIAVTLQTGCSSFGCAYPCLNCGRLHWPTRGIMVENRGGEKVYLIEGKVILK